MYSTNMNNFSVQNVFFPLHDLTLFQGHGMSQKQDLKLGVLECRVYYNVLLNTKSQIDFDRLLQQNTLDNSEVDNDMSRECYKILDY
jgi:hypothetical protein